jgi:hypothetical protein
VPFYTYDPYIVLLLLLLLLNVFADEPCVDVETTNRRPGESRDRGLRMSVKCKSKKMSS